MHVHSIVIGISLGVTKGIPEITRLTIALSFHQFLEGIGVGYIVKDALMPHRPIKAICMGVMYSITAPAGILIGTLCLNRISITTPGTYPFIAQKSLHGISTGMLVYISLVQLVAQELHKNNTLKHKLLLHATLLLGATLMCILAIWI